MFDVIIEDEDKLKQVKYFLTGFQGLGSVGYIAIKHIIDEKKATRVGVIKSKAAPPFIYLENDKIVLPFELYVYNDVLIFLPRLPPYRHTETDFVESLIDWVLKLNKIELGILIGGVDANLKTETDGNVKYVPTKKYIKEKSDLIKLENNLLSSGLMIQGPLAIMLGNFDLSNFPGLGILSFADRERPDPQGAASAIEIVNTLLNLDCSISELISNLDIFDGEIKNIPSSAEDYESRGPPETYT